MKNAEAMLTTNGTKGATRAPALAGETRELENLHKGLLRHLNAWRGAHDAATERLAGMLARIDALTARIERAGS